MLAARIGAVARAWRGRKLALWIAGVAAGYAALGFFAAPPILKWQLEHRLSEALQRNVTLQAVRVNPFAPSVALRGLAITERGGGAHFVGFDELYVDAAWTSVFRLAPVVDRIRLAKPFLRVVRHPDGTYNFQDLLEASAQPPGEEREGALPRFALFNIEILDGRIHFDDRLEGERHVATGLGVGIPFVSTLPAHVEVDVQPYLAVQLNGAPLRLSGEAQPFAQARTTTLEVNLAGFDLTRIVPYLPVKARARLASALLDARLVVAFDQPAGETPRLRVRGSAALADARLLDAHDRPVLAFQRLGVTLNELEPFASRYAIKSVALEGAELHVRRHRSGALNLAELGPVGSAGESESGSGAAPALEIERLTLELAKLTFVDESTAPAFRAVLEEGRIEGSGFSLEEGARSQWSVSAVTDASETLRLAARMSLEPLAAEGRVDLGTVKLARYQPYVAGVTELQVERGELDLGVSFDWAAEPRALRLADVALALRALQTRLPGEPEPLLRVGALRVLGAGADLAARTASLGEIDAEDVHLALRREADGTLNLARLATRDTEPVPDETPPAQPWRIDLPRASLAAALAFEDLFTNTPARIRIDSLALEATRLSTARGERGNLSVRAVIDGSGRLSASGPLSLDPPAARLEVAAQEIGLLAAQPYLDPLVHLALTSGTLSMKGTAAFEQPPDGPLNVSYRGEARVGGFTAVDKRSTNDLLKWKALSVTGIDFRLAPLSVSLDEAKLSGYYARIILSEEGRLNLQDLAVQAEAAPAAPAVATPRVRIGSIVLENGNIDYSDFYVKPSYSANLTGVGGAVTEMTPAKAGDVALRGKLDGAAPVAIAGRVNPLAPDLFVDLEASAKDIELAPLTPYSVKYAGYNIERGKLTITAAYDIAERKLNAANRIYLDQFTFGERVESPTATTLPVTFAVALLKDRNGVIDLDLPISGSLDDPQFSFGGMVAKVLVNLIAKAVTSPFALLGALVGGGPELAYVEFPAGSAALADIGRSKLEKLAKALAERPGLRLEVTGRAAPEADREVLAREALQARLRSEKFRDLQRAGAAPASADAVTIEPEEYEKYLRLAHREVERRKAGDTLVVAADLPVPEMEQALLVDADISESRLRRLAMARAQAARDWLVREGSVPAERVFLVAPKLAAEGKEGSELARVDFGLR